MVAGIGGGNVRLVRGGLLQQSQATVSTGFGDPGLFWQLSAWDLVADGF